MKMQYNKGEIDNPTVRAVIIAAINDAQHGGFMRVHGLTPKTGHGEVANYTFCKGINYANSVKKSLELLADIESNPNYQITVTRGVWKNAAGEQSPTNRQSKVFNVPATVTKTYGMENPALLAALAKIRQSLIAPAPVTKEYVKLGNGIYEDENGVLFLRDLRVIRKDVIKHGDYPFAASGEETAIADTIKRDMPVGKYRQFRFDGDYDAITLGGMELSQDLPAPALEPVAQVKTAAALEPVNV